MSNRNQRLNAMRHLITKEHISTQQQLQQKLKDMGFEVTQATLSRDLKMMHVNKISDNNGQYVYHLHDDNQYTDIILRTGKHSPRPHTGVLSIEFSGNIMVVKTRNGYATALAYDIDMGRCPEFIGTIAGADTVFAVLSEGVDHEQAREAMERFLPKEN